MTECVKISEVWKSGMKARSFGALMYPIARIVSVDKEELKKMMVNIISNKIIVHVKNEDPQVLHYKIKQA